MKKRVFAIFLAFMFIFSASSITASATSGIHYFSMDYSEKITIGTPSTGTMTWATPIALTISGANGAGKGYNVSLEKDKEYIFKFKAVSSRDVLHVLNIAVMNNVMTGTYSNDVLSTSVIIHEYGKTAATAVRFKAPSTGYFKLLVTEGSFTFDDYDNTDVTYTVGVSELLWQKVEINNLSDLEAFRVGINSFATYSAELDVTLKGNIDMLNSSWGVGIKYFSGKFDGKGYTVSKFGVGEQQIDNVGFFDKVMGNAVVKNLNVSVILATGATSVGALAGSAEYATFENCTSSGSVRAAVASSGGLVGDAQYCTFKNCSSSCTVSNLLAQSGGLAGYARAGTVFEGCFATGNVNGSTDVGGFVGTASTGVSMSDCYATGNASGYLSITGLSVGGFVGLSGMSVVIDECYATGSAKGVAEVGGFAGVVSSSGTIKNSYSTGAVSSTIDISLNSGFGGFVGSIISSGYFIANCYTVSDINCYGNRIGGFAGSIESVGQCTFRNDYAAGAIVIRNSASNFGGFLGKPSSNSNYVSTTDNCFFARQDSLINGASMGLPACYGYNVASFMPSSVDFNNEEAVTEMTTSLNDYAAENDGFDGWSGKNVKNGPSILFDASVGKAELNNVLDWVRKQSMFLQIPLWIFYVPIQFFASLFR